ncbi:MAG: hypothetical protein K2Y39_05115 [Candidatus Obscuribacterales bacterium]|nr:hypothetical protein [Candidatus Obscuribacterales bacterium]
MTESNSAEQIPEQRMGNSASMVKRQSVGKVLWCAFALAGCCIAVTQLLFPAHFETVDDINFTLLLSGVGLSHSPTYSTWFTNVLITYPLMCLYKALPDIPWYSIYLFSSLLFGFSIIAAVLMLRFNRGVGTTLFLIYYVLVGAFIVNGLQYTSTTALLTQAAFLLACCLPLTMRFSSNKYPQWAIVAAVVATVFAAMMRFEPFMLIILYCLITAVAVAPWNMRLIKRNSLPIICFAVSVLLGVGLKFANNFYYDSQPAYAGIREFFKPFSDIADSDRMYPGGVKLSENDFALVKQFFVADREVFTTELLSQAAQKAELPFTTGKLLWTLESEILPLALLCLILLPLLDTRIISKFGLLIWFAGLSSLILYLSFWMKMPPRLHLALMTCAMTTLFVFTDRQKLKRIIQKLQHEANPKKALISIALCSVAVWFTYSTISELQRDLHYYNEKLARITQAIQRLNPQPGHLYIVLGTAAPYQYMRPFQNLRKYFSRFDIYRTSLWGILPSGYNMLENHGISSLYDACKSQNVYFVSDQKTNQLFADFCAEHYKYRPLFICVFADPSADFEVYRIKFKPI